MLNCWQMLTTIYKTNCQQSKLKNDRCWWSKLKNDKCWWSKLKRMQFWNKWKVVGKIEIRAPGCTCTSLDTRARHRCIEPQHWSGCAKRRPWHRCERAMKCKSYRTAEPRSSLRDIGQIPSLAHTKHCTNKHCTLLEFLLFLRRSFDCK